MEIHNPRRILLCSPPETDVSLVLKALTGNDPSSKTAAKPALAASSSSLSSLSNSLIGTTHDWAIKTAYYTATVAIWIDEIAGDATEWRDAFMSAEAKEVRDAVGAYVFVFRHPLREAEMIAIEKGLTAIKNVIDHTNDEGGPWDGVCLAMRMPQTETPYLTVSHDQWEDKCRDHGFEFVDFEQKGKNEFGELCGINRVREALEANEWESDDYGELNEFELDGEDEELGFGIEANEVERELFGLRSQVRRETSPSAENINDHDNEQFQDEESQVDELEGMMKKLIAAREMSEGMSETERKRFAKKTVDSIVKSM